MKTIILISIFAFILGNSYSQTGNQNQISTAEFKVLGECGMCKARIEKAAKTDGVASAVWNKDSKILKVEYLPSKIKVETIHRNIAKAGHDTEKEKADDSVYNTLPACCKYERNLNHQGHKH